MHAQVIKHQKDLASRLLDKFFKKLDKSKVIEVTVDDYPACLSLIGHSGNHRTENPDRLSMGCINILDSQMLVVLRVGWVAPVGKINIVLSQ
jgi:hypothetical protein